MLALLFQWFLYAAALLIVSKIVPGFHVRGIWPALIAALVIGFLNVTLGFFLKIVTFPLTILTLGIFLLVILLLLILLLLFAANRNRRQNQAVVVGPQGQNPNQQGGGQNPNQQNPN